MPNPIRHAGRMSLVLCLSIYLLRGKWPTCDCNEPSSGTWLHTRSELNRRPCFINWKRYTVDCRTEIRTQEDENICYLFWTDGAIGDRPVLLIKASRRFWCKMDIKHRPVVN